jgi:hypothetical protein
MKGLMLHCGGQLKTREEVFAVPSPVATKTYAPLPYESFILRIQKQLAVEGITIKVQRSPKPPPGLTEQAFDEIVIRR